jgi:MFS transporter, AAHS family, 4-hydroxybenzoate transporter
MSYEQSTPVLATTTTRGMETRLMSHQEMNVTELIDRSEISAFQILIVALCFLVLVLDGFDTVAVSYIAPVIRSHWHLQAPQLAPFFGAGLAGLMAGALLIGPIADQFGRRRVLLLSVLCFGVTSLVSAGAGSLQALIVLRFLTGVGLGGAIPNAITLTSEYSPASRRSLLATIMISGFSVGSAVAGFASAAMIDRYGWRSVLVMGGIAPLILLPWLAWRLPESVRYLVETGGQPSQIAAQLRKIVPHVNFGDTKFVMSVSAQSGSPVVRLFQGGLAFRTLLLWLTFFMSLLVMYLLISWLPSMLRASGVSLRASALVGAMFQVGGTMGGVVLGWFMDRFHPPRVLSFTYILAGLSTASVGSLSAAPFWAGIAVFLTGFFIAGSHIGLNAFSALLYPTECRATGVSWANSVGRLGSVVGAIAGGILLATNLPMPELFVVIGLPTLAASFFMHTLGRSRLQADALLAEFES